MALEIEKKYPITPDLRGTLIDGLKEIGAVFEGRTVEENTIYRGGVLDETGGVVRLRRTAEKATLTFKMRIERDSDAKTQIEHESEISDPDAVAEILAQLGLEARIVYEKRRETWKLRDAEIVLDELPFGLFMEIEGSITAIKEAEILLGIEDLPAEARTYPSLTTELGTNVDGVIEARF
jgi:adenylate cyclase, class 2